MEIYKILPPKENSSQALMEHSTKIAHIWNLGLSRTSHPFLILGSAVNLSLLPLPLKYILGQNLYLNKFKKIDNIMSPL